MTVPDKYPLPHIGSLIDQLHHSAVFSKMDVRWGYNNIRINPKHQKYAAFKCEYGIYEPRVIFFGLRNSPATFQRFMNYIFRDLIDQGTIVVYMDDILVHTQDRVLHDKILTEVLKRLQDNDLFLRPSKCTFYQDSIEFLGFIISKGKVEMDPSKVAAIKEWKTPKSVHQIQSFLGFANFYRRFIKDFSKIAAPLNQLTKKDTPFVWEKEQDTAFETLKTIFTSTPFLILADLSKPFRLETDASLIACSGILSQQAEDGNWHPIAYFSQTNLPAERNYPIHDLEMLAIIKAIKNWRQYLLGAPYKIQILSDHNNLRYFMTKQILNPRQARWASYLQQYNFEIVYRSGASNPADALSRPIEMEKIKKTPQVLLPSHRLQDFPPDYLNAYPLAVETPPVYVRSSSIVTEDGSIEEYWTAPELPESPDLVLTHPYLADMEDRLDNVFIRLQTVFERALRQEIEQPTITEIEPAFIEQIKATYERLNVFHIIKQARQLKPDAYKDWIIHNDLIYLNDAIYVPKDEELYRTLLRQYHDSPIYGHPGKNVTYVNIRRLYWWPKMMQYIERYVAGCHDCQTSKHTTHRSKVPSMATEIPIRPFQILTSDFITGLPLTDLGHNAIHVIIDAYTKYAIFIACNTTITAKQTAEHFINHVWYQFGFPQKIISDRGPQFAAEFFQELTKDLGIRSALSTAFHPQTDGQTERINQHLEQYLRVVSSNNPDSWEELLPFAQFAHNAEETSAIGMAPFEALYGFVPSGIPEPIITINNLDAKQRAQNLRDNWNETHAALIRSKEVISGQFPAVLESQVPFRIGDEVYLNGKQIKTLYPSTKLAPRFYGPFTIKAIHGLVSAELILPKTWNKVHPVFHMSLFRPAQKTPEYGPTHAHPAPDLIKGQEEYEVDFIVASRQRRNAKCNIQYKVRWKGFEAKDDTWEPAIGLYPNAQEAISEFHQKYPEMPGPLTPAQLLQLLPKN